ncbi:MAG TPA: hypothetical protein VFC24_09575 [Casimicrobiaceae bacterium]|nr:hypothetical protein [Casimicrobiaceae bacterium]
MNHDDEQIGRTSRQLEYRGFDVHVAASFRFGGIFVSARLTGGPQNIARQFGLPSAERSLERACDVALDDIRGLIDRLLAQPPGLPGASED